MAHRGCKRRIGKSTPAWRSAPSAAETRRSRGAAAAPQHARALRTARKWTSDSVDAIATEGVPRRTGRWCPALWVKEDADVSTVILFFQERIEEEGCRVATHTTFTSKVEVTSGAPHGLCELIVAVTVIGPRFASARSSM